MSKARHGEKDHEEIVTEYEVFKSRTKDMNDPKSETDIGEIVTRFEHFLFKSPSWVFFICKLSI